MLVRTWRGLELSSLLELLSLCEQVCSPGDDKISWALRLLFNMFSLLNLKFFGKRVDSVLKLLYDPAFPLQLPPLRNRDSQGTPSLPPNKKQPPPSQPPPPATTLPVSAVGLPPRSKTSCQEVSEHFSVKTYPWSFCYLTHSVISLINVPIFDQGKKYEESPKLLRYIWNVRGEKKQNALEGWFFHEREMWASPSQLTNGLQVTFNGD